VRRRGAQGTVGFGRLVPLDGADDRSICGKGVTMYVPTTMRQQQGGG